MGIFNRYKAQNAGAWQAGQKLDLEFDFDANALCGLKLREPATLLAKFGPPEDAAALKAGAHCFLSQGFEADVTNGRVDTFILVLRDADKRFQPFAGKCVRGGATLPLRAGATEGEVVACLGEPFWRDEDDDEVLLFYERNAVEWQVEVDKRAGLSVIVATALPLLADAEQRAAFRVTKPWPPRDGVEERG